MATAFSEDATVTAFAEGGTVTALAEGGIVTVSVEKASLSLDNCPLLQVSAASAASMQIRTEAKIQLCLSISS